MPILNLWNFTTPDGRGIAKAIEYMYPYIRDKKSWTKPADVMYFEYWPMREEALLFVGLAYGHRLSRPVEEAARRFRC